MGPSKITWLFLWRLSAGNLLTAKVLFDICGTEDFSLVPSNRCFYRLFSLAQIWDECGGSQDPKDPCIASCLLEDFCSELYTDRVTAGSHHCERLVSCIQKDSESPAAVQACYEGHPLPQEGLLKGWLSNLALGAGEVTLPVPAPAPAPAEVEKVSISRPAPAPAAVTITAPKEVIEENEETLPVSAPAFATAPQVSRAAAPAPAPATAPVQTAPTTAVQKEVIKEILPHVSEPVAPAPSSAEVWIRPAAPTAPPPQPAAPQKVLPVSCNCSISGHVKGIETGRLGCAAHNKESQAPSETKYCFMEGGSQCKDQPGAKPSTEFAGLYWKPCREIDNFMAIFPQSCQVFQSDRRKGDAAHQLVSKIKELQSSEGSHSLIPSRPLEDMKQWIASWDVAPRKTVRRLRQKRSISL